MPVTSVQDICIVFCWLSRFSRLNFVTKTVASVFSLTVLLTYKPTNEQDFLWYSMLLVGLSEKTDCMLGSVGTPLPLSHMSYPIIFFHPCHDRYHVAADSVSDSEWIQDGKNDYKNRKQLRNFIFLRAGYSLLRAEGFFCSLDVLYGHLWIAG